MLKSAVCCSRLPACHRLKTLPAHFHTNQEISSLIRWGNPSGLSITGSATLEDDRDIGWERGRDEREREGAERERGEREVRLREKKGRDKRDREERGREEREGAERWGGDVFWVVSVSAPALYGSQILQQL